ncbi:MAG: hypothetical protein GF317_04965 [Candidatus Lokiarchaeota archaeon]|nr:hypothetical protein [Candidatus Lokiarchaeota archaeon]
MNLKESVNVFEGKTLSDIYINQIRNVMHNGESCAPRGLKIKELQPAITIIHNSVPILPLLFCPGRNWNPFFAIAELIWVLAGDEKTEWICKFNKSLIKFSNDKKKFDGAYGHRIRNHFIGSEAFVSAPVDQLKEVYDKLFYDKDTRQAVMVLWDAYRDNLKGSYDYPCNDMVMFKVRDNKLNMTVCNRSNDLILGLPYNVCVFGGIQRVLASMLGVNIGRQIHYSDSLHIYESEFERANMIIKRFVNFPFTTTALRNDSFFEYKNGFANGGLSVKNLEELDFITLAIKCGDICDLLINKKYDVWANFYKFLNSYLYFVKREYNECLKRFLFVGDDILFLNGAQYYLRVANERKGKKKKKHGASSVSVIDAFMASIRNEIKNRFIKQGEDYWDVVKYNYMLAFVEGENYDRIC